MASQGNVEGWAGMVQRSKEMEHAATIYSESRKLQENAKVFLINRRPGRQIFATDARSKTKMGFCLTRAARTAVRTGGRQGGFLPA